MKKKIVLASASPRRMELLKQIGLPFETFPAQGEEKSLKESPEEYVQELSMQKAMEIAAQTDSDTLVIGADTAVAYWNAIMGKPEDKEAATAMLHTLQGNTHQVYTGVSLIWKEQGMQMNASFFECTDVTVYPMTPEEIEAYVETGEPMDKAGAYGIQGRFAAHIQGICGDYSNVVGLPVGRLYQELKKRRLI